MQFFYSGKPTPTVLSNPPADLMDAVRGDWAKAREYYARGIFRQMWMLGRGMIAICEADSREQLEALCAELPMKRAGYIEYEITELAPYRGFAPEPAAS